MINPIISIIVPCYNQAQYLDECLQSVLEQTYTHWECIIVNDGSQDNTEEIAKEWVRKDSRYKYTYKENGGLSRARNTGLEVVKGDYIQFLDADDTINRFKFEKQLNYFSEDIDLVICDYFPFDNETGAFVKWRYLNPFPDLNNYKNDIITKWESQLSIPCHCVLFKTKLLLRSNPLTFDESIPNHEDWHFWVQLFYYSSGIFNLNETLANYRIHKESMCNDNLKMKEGFIFACKSLCYFFKSIDNKNELKLCQEKLKVIENKKEFSLTKIIKLFIPPVFVLLRRKIFKYTDVSK